VAENRSPLISKKYEKAGRVLDVFVAQVSDGDIVGQVFQCETWESGFEKTEKRVTSGNQYEIRREFFKTLLDLVEDGWSKKGAANYGSPNGKFYDPAEL